MGARQSKRSVDITTTPKKGEGEVLAEGDGKVEKLPEIDAKAITNGAVHTEIEYADKDETGEGEKESKESESAQQQQEEIKENGVSESEDAKTPDAEKQTTPEGGDQLNESTTPNEKSTESSDNKIEESTETKKCKEKNKKKKWSFRSISFSKKTKPSKDSDKNGDVKEVAEENAEDATSPSAETPKTETPAEAPITNGNATAEELAKPVDDDEKKPEETAPAAPIAAVEEPAAKVEEPVKPTTPPASEPVAETVKETVAEPAAVAPPTTIPVAETNGESQQVEEEPHKPVENPVVEETKEVRSEEVPPPLPASNPPSPVTVFAESTKADAIPVDQVPVPVPEPVVESIPTPKTPEPVVETIPEQPKTPEPVVESVPQATSSPVAEQVPEAIVESVPESIVSPPMNDVIPSNEAIESVVPLSTEPEEPAKVVDDNINNKSVDEPEIVPEPEIASPTLPEPIESRTVDTTETIENVIDNLPEPVSEPVHGDSLPDVSTESLPSLPEPVSESLPEPMSLPPVESVPEPIANDVVIPSSEPEPVSAVDQTSSIPSPLKDIPEPTLPILTNGTTNGLNHSSPTSNDVCLPAKEELKQIPDIGKDIRQEDGDNPVVEAVGGTTVARVEE